MVTVIFHYFIQGSDPKKQKKEPLLVQRKGAVASAFNDEVQVDLFSNRQVDQDSCSLRSRHSSMWGAWSWGMQKAQGTRGESTCLETPQNRCLLLLP